ncbi:MAG: division/cell wall cluster transcriptional repressor MraZ [Lachnospiraceae bacterium]|nr:division/cell wall cluster transcriptional repressor MraZ [Lachnospiraceae bacterium]
MYRGEYTHSIDAKGRLIVPSKLRETLGDSFVLTKGLDGCLMAYDTEEWEEFETKLQELPVTNKNARKLVRHFSGGAADAECDSQGRVLIPANLREYAGLTKEAVLLGMGNRIEIWSKERYETEGTYEDMDEVASALEDMGLGI